jgi:signal transduction histidine kinase
MELPPSRPAGLDKKRTVILLRSVVVISTSYLILFGDKALSGAAIAYILALILSELALTWTPRQWFHEPRFSVGLLLTDTAVVLIGLYLTVGCFSQDFLIIYFFTIFLTTATSSVGQIALGAAVISALYGYWLWLTAGHVLGAGEWLRLPFFFIVAVFYAYVTEETKQERYRRELAERESEHLRLLLGLGDVFSRQIATREVVAQVADVVEAAFPALRCRMLTTPDAAARAGTTFLLHSHGETFGALEVTAAEGSAPSPEVYQFCKVVAVVAANALHTAEQMGAAQAGVRLKNEFLATISHELRSPLHVILGNAEILSEALAPGADRLARESIERLRANAYRLLDVVEEMLCFAELRAGRSAVHHAPVNLHDLFEQLGSMMREQLAGRPIRFQSSIAADVPPLLTDERKLRLIVNGLLSNAAKFTEKGVVQLTAVRRAADQIEITVRDTGIGIDAKDFPALFEEFRQVDGSLKRRFEGLGLGLTLARDLAALLGGRLDLDSAPQCGSTFRLILPLPEEAAAVSPAAVHARLQLHPAA